LVITLPAASEPLPELLKPVGPDIEAKLMAKSNYEFRLQRYPAKLFRIVDINWALLDQPNAVFTITPFQGPEYWEFAVTVSTETTSRAYVEGAQREWVGKVENSAAIA
jgi:hypothetical protein